MTYPTGRCPFCGQNDIEIYPSAEVKTDADKKDPAKQRLTEHPTKPGANNSCGGSHLPPSVLT